MSRHSFLLRLQPVGTCGVHWQFVRVIIRRRHRSMQASSSLPCECAMETGYDCCSICTKSTTANVNPRQDVTVQNSRRLCDSLWLRPSCSWTSAVSGNMTSCSHRDRHSRPVKNRLPAQTPVNISEALAPLFFSPKCCCQTRPAQRELPSVSEFDDASSN